MRFGNTLLADELQRWGGHGGPPLQIIASIANILYAFVGVALRGHPSSTMQEVLTSLARWQDMWRQLGASSSDDALFTRLVECYSEPHRKYHTMQHLQECFTHLESVRSLAERAGEVELALWFHDAFYDTRRKDNEERSAEWARDSALAAGLDDDQATRTYELVMATMHNAVPAGQDAAVLLDIDLAILGADEARFDEYEIQVREEYSWVPRPLYRSGRRKILQEFVRRESIYSTEYFRVECEARARRNIERSLARL